MLTPLLHRKRKAAQQALAGANDVIGSAGDALERNRQIYGTRLLVRGILWMSLYGISRGLLALDVQPAAARVAVALLPTPFFVWWLWTWMDGVSKMDELERRIELEALALAFPLAVILLMTLGLLDTAIGLNPDDFSLRHVWAMMPVLYYFGLWRAKRRYA
jgi:hypothetical protein